MKSCIFAILSAALFAAQASAQSTLTVNTPTNVLSCTALMITWTGGSGPYTLSVHPGTDVNGAALVTFTNLNGTSYTWSSVTFAPNTNLDLTLRDSGGDVSQSAPFTVQSGGPTTCLNTTGTTTPLTVTGSATGSTPATTAGTTNSAGTSGTNSGTTKGASSGTATSSSKPASSSSAATPIGVSYGVAGVIGAAIAAVFV